MRSVGRGGIIDRNSRPSTPTPDRALPLGPTLAFEAFQISFA
jgi:hypothetical protein